MPTTKTEGFFSTSGVLKTASTTTTAPQPTTASDVEDAAAASTAQAITEAVVTKITSRLDIGATGFDKGVADYVAGAVAKALDKKGASTDPSSVSLLDIGGSYQNEILYGVQNAPSPGQQPDGSTQPASSDPATPPSTGNGGRARGHGPSTIPPKSRGRFAREA
jgi:hypothetical protein